jgi:ribosomal protein S19
MIIQKNIKIDDFQNLKKNYVDYKLYAKIQEVLLTFKDPNDYLNQNYIIKTKSRASTIYPCFVNLMIHVYNGKRYIPIRIFKDCIGHKLGEFVLTRNFIGHKKKNRATNIKRKVPTNSLYRKYFENLTYKDNSLYLKQLLYIKRLKNV